MPISIDYDRDENVIYTKAEGLVKLDDIIAYFTSAAALKPHPGYRVLGDYSDATLDLSNDDLFEMAQQRKTILATSAKIRIAIHCRADLVFGLGRVYEAFLDDEKYDIMIFRSRQEAMEWLGL